MTTILLVEDHHIVRRGLHALLEAEPDFRIVGEASDGLEACEMVELLKPDVVVLDLVIPGLNGIEVTGRIRLNSPRTKVVVLSMYDDESYVMESLRAGARAYVLKRSTLDELVNAIREIIAGHYYLAPPLSVGDVEYMQMAKEDWLDPYEKLTAREREVLQLTSEGCNRVEIATRLAISPRTVEAHRANLMHKLGLHTKSDLIRYALRRGLLPLDG